MYHHMSRLSIVPTSPKESKPQEEIEYRELFNEQSGVAKEARDKGIHLPNSTQKNGPVSFTQDSEHLLGAMLICQGRVTATRLEQTRESTHGGMKGETLVLGLAQGHLSLLCLQRYLCNVYGWSSPEKSSCMPLHMVPSFQSTHIPSTQLQLTQTDYGASSPDDDE